METLKQIIEKLEATRIEKNLSYDEVAKMIESSKSSIWKVLTGLSIPNGDTLLKLIDCLGYDFKVRKKSTIENFVENVNRISKEQVKEIETIIPDAKIKGLKKVNSKNIEIQNNSEKKKITKKIDVSECPNCKYSETASGLRIKILKCDNCKTKKSNK